MIVRVEKLKVELDKYNDIVSNYENLKMKLYSELKYLSTFWSDDSSPDFFDKVNFQRIDCEEMISNMKSLSEIYSYVIYSYEDLGKEIEFDLSLRDNLMVKFEKCINEFDYIIDIYDSMDLSLIEEKDMYLEQRKVFVNSKTKLVNYKSNIDKILSDINEIEAQVRSKIRKINVKLIYSEVGEI